MSDCDKAREQLALQPSSDDERLRQHLDECIACARYSRQHQSLDMVLRSELYWVAPAALTAQLLALAAAPVGAASAPLFAVRPRPKGWYVTVVYVLTAVAIGLSLAVAWQFMGLLTAQIGLDDALTRLLAAPAQGLAQLMQLVQTVPGSRLVIAFVLKLHDQLLWLLLVAVLWAALDKWNPQFSFSRQQA
jgi:hypothetical protein